MSTRTGYFVFEYIPSITLLGGKADWEKLGERMESAGQGDNKADGMGFQVALDHLFTKIHDEL